MEYTVITFHSISEALNFEKVMQAQGLNVRLIPVPREISSSCGMAAKLALEDQKKVLNLAEEKNLIWDGVYVLKEKPKKKSLFNLLKNN